MQILLVDDNKETAQLYQLNFKIAGHTTAIAEDGPQALAVLRADSGRFDIVILDYQMPGMNGLETVREIRQIETQKQVPVVLLSGYDAEHIPNDPLLGVKRVLQKPILPTQLLAVIEEIIQGDEL